MRLFAALTACAIVHGLAERDAGLLVPLALLIMASTLAPIVTRLYVRELVG